MQEYVWQKMGESKKPKNNPFLHTAKPLHCSRTIKSYAAGGAGGAGGEGEGGEGKQALHCWPRCMSQLQMKTAKDVGLSFLPKPHFRGRTLKTATIRIVMDHSVALSEVPISRVCVTNF